ncbi:MAG TPA: hypothetical protein VKF79_05845 [Candidatus Acidoferrum sp.]|nr:hypothetical protein [Candidatus Acidoferrum sp.]
MPREQRAIDPLENRLKAELSPEEFVTAVTVARKIEILDRVTSGALNLLWFLCIATMGLYYMVAMGYAHLPERLMIGLERATVGQVIALLTLIVRGVLAGGTSIASNKRKKGGS